MRLYLSLFCFFSCGFMTYSQNCQEFQTHQKSIKSNYIPLYELDQVDTVENANVSFYNYIIQHNLRNANDSCFISNRGLLRSIPTKFRYSSRIIFEAKTYENENCKVIFTLEPFHPEMHQIEYSEDSVLIEKIDQKYPYGGQYSIPKTRIKDINIIWGNQSLKIPKSCYNQFYDPWMGETTYFLREIEAYFSLDEEYIYLYIYGGEAAGTYFLKLIFDKSGYVTQILSEYGALSINGAFREGFIGF